MDIHYFQCIFNKYFFKQYALHNDLWPETHNTLHKSYSKIIRLASYDRKYCWVSLFHLVPHKITQKKSKQFFCFGHKLYKNKALIKSKIKQNNLSFPFTDILRSACSCKVLAERFIILGGNAHCFALYLKIHYIVLLF